MSFNFVADRVTQGRAYPALACHQAEPYTTAWRQFAHHWPYTVPCELIEHCQTHEYPHRIYLITEAFPACSWYVIGLGWFDFATDYFALLSPHVCSHLQQGQLRVLFYYHEGDNPHRIQQRLDQLVATHGLPADCYKFVSANSQADHCEHGAYFADHELLYWHRNRRVAPTPVQTLTPYDFTLLSRTHKWWRATVVADLHNQGMLQHSQWSYNTQCTIADAPGDNPIEQDLLGLQHTVDRFVAAGPYRCDDLSADQHNDHHAHIAQHYTQSRCNIVLETHFDADQSGGTFLTEKTFKPIKHGQPFVLIAPPHSLAQLRSMGYRTFDHVMDNRYDAIENNTDRYLALRDTIQQIKNHPDPAAWIAQCRSDVLHNQQLFAESKYCRIDQLYQKLQG